MKNKLSKEMLDSVAPGQCIFRGDIEDSPDGFYINGTGKVIKWMAIKGYADDWCIYVEDCYRDMGWAEIRTNGHKIFRETAKAVIDAPQEVWNCWRG